MSNFCFCVIENIIEAKERKRVFKKIEKLAQKYDCAICDLINWQEPVVSAINQDSYIISINDSKKEDICELFLLPDGWYYNNKTNIQSFFQRARFFEDIAEMIMIDGYDISFYIAQSGTTTDEFENYVISQSDIVLLLSESIGNNGVDTGLHIQIK